MKSIASVVGAIIALVGLPSGISWFFSRVTLDVGTPSYQSNPLTAAFVISNGGSFRISDIKYKFAMLHLAAGGGPNLNMHGKNVFVTDSSKDIPVLRRDEKRSLSFPPQFIRMAQDVHQCEIEVVITYRPFPWLIAKETRYRLEAMKDVSGNWGWHYKATSENY